MSNYWKKRISKDEEKAQEIAETYASKQKAYYQKMIREINDYIDMLYGRIADGKQITRSELWQYEHYKRMREAIYEQCKGLAKVQVETAEKALDAVVQDVLGVKWKDNDSVSILSKQQTKQFLNQEWSGESYSSRVYKNCNQLATKLQEEISNMIVLGKSPDAVKKAVMDECGVSYKVANRLIRTETSYTFNSASKDRYEKMGANRIEILVEPDACDECQDLAGEYDFNEVPLLPVHPNCRCCYIPVV